MRRPTRKQIERVVSWLNENDIDLYGPNMDTKTGQEFHSLMDYDVEECIQRHDHLRKGTNWHDPKWDC